MDTNCHRDADCCHGSPCAGDRRTSIEVSPYTSYARSDCNPDQEHRFVIVAPNGSAMPMRPLTIDEAESIIETLNNYLPEQDQ